jgi:hypothetical protein
MRRQFSALAADTKLETPEGSMTVRAVAGQAVSVLSRGDTGEHVFRLMQDVEKVAEQQPVVKLTLENGRSFRLGREQVVFKAGMVETPVTQIVVGDQLESAFSFPAGYVYRDDDGNPVTSTGAVAVAKIEAGGSADVYRLGVNQTQKFFLSAGVLCKADALD